MGKQPTPDYNNTALEKKFLNSPSMSGVSLTSAVRIDIEKDLFFLSMETDTEELVYARCRFCSYVVSDKSAKIVHMHESEKIKKRIELWMLNNRSEILRNEINEIDKEIIEEIKTTSKKADSSLMSGTKENEDGLLFSDAKSDLILVKKCLCSQGCAGILILSEVEAVVSKEFKLPLPDIAMKVWPVLITKSGASFAVLECLGDLLSAKAVLVAVLLNTIIHDEH